MLNWLYKKDNEYVEIVMGDDGSWLISSGRDSGGCKIDWGGWHELHDPGAYHDYLISEGYEAV